MVVFNIYYVRQNWKQKLESKLSDGWKFVTKIRGCMAGEIIERVYDVSEGKFTLEWENLIN